MGERDAPRPEEGSQGVRRGAGRGRLPAEGGGTDVSSEIAELVDIDRQLADDAITEAEGTPANSPKRAKEIEEANKELAKGDADRTDGKLKQAIDHYKHAWEHAQKAIEATG